MNKWMTRAAVLSLMIVGGITSVLAQSKLYIEDFSISAGESKQVAVCLDTDAEDIQTVSMNIQLPAGLSFETMDVLGKQAIKTTVASPRTSGFNAIGNPSDGKISLSGISKIPAGTGAIFYISVRATDDLAITSAITLANAAVLGDEEYTEANGKLTVRNPKVTKAGDLTLEFSETELTLDPEAAQSVAVNLTNQGKTIYGFQADVIIPEGWTYGVTNGRLTNNGANNRILYASATEPVDGEEGALFTLDLTAPEKFVGEAVIKLTNISVTANFKDETLSDITLTIKSTADDTKAAADAIVEELQEKLNEAKAAIEANDADVAADYAEAIAELEQKVAELKQSVEDNYGTKNLVAADIQAAADAIATEVEQVKADADQAQVLAKTANKEAIESAYDEAAAAIESTKAIIEEQFGDYVAVSSFANKFNQLEKEIADSKAALENVDFSDAEKAVEAANNAQAIVDKQAATLNDLLSTAANKAQTARLAEVEELANAITYNENLYTLGDVKEIKAQQKAIEEAIAAAKQNISDVALSDETNPYAENENIQDNLDTIIEQIEALKNYIKENKSVLEGDVNLDGVVTSADIVAVTNIISGTDTQFVDTADVNGDGQVTAADIVAIVNIISQ